MCLHGGERQKKESNKDKIQRAKKQKDTHKKYGEKNK